MAPRKRSQPMTALLDNEDVIRLIRDVSRMSETTERGREDRQEIKGILQKMELSIDTLRGSVNSLNQTMISTSTQVSQIALEKCGERLTALENIVKEPNVRALADRLFKIEGDIRANRDDIKENTATLTRWRKWMGEGWSFFGRIIIAIAASGLLGGTIFGLSAKVLQHL